MRGMDKLHQLISNDVQFDKISRIMERIGVLQLALNYLSFLGSCSVHPESELVGCEIRHCLQSHIDDALGQLAEPWRTHTDLCAAENLRMHGVHVKRTGWAVKVAYFDVYEFHARYRTAKGT